MEEMLLDVQEAIQKIKDRKLANIYLVLGEEEYQANELRKNLLKLIPNEEKNFNIAEYDMEDVPLSDAINDAMSAPFFGDMKLVFINHPYFLTGEKKKTKVEHELTELESYLERPLDTTVLVINALYPKLDERKKIVKLLKQRAQIIKNQSLNENQIRQLIIKKFNDHHCEIDSDALSLLIERTGENLNQAMNEVDKLIINVQNGDKVNFQKVKNLVPQTLEQNVFDLVDLVLDHQTDTALQMYHELILQREEPLKINAILLGQFRLLLQVKILHSQGYAQGNIASTLKVHPYRIKLALRKINRFKMNDLINAYLGLIDNEQKMKSTNQNPELLFQLFLLKI